MAQGWQESKKGVSMAQRRHSMILDSPATVLMVWLQWLTEVVGMSWTKAMVQEGPDPTKATIVVAAAPDTAAATDIAAAPGHVTFQR